VGFNQQDETEKPLLPPLLFGGILLEGGVISFDSNLMTGGAGARYFGLGSSGQYRVDRITIYLRAISTSNGRILKTVYTSKTILSQQIDVGIFRFVDFQRLLEAETGFTYNEPSEIAVREAIEKAVTSLIIEGAVDGLWKFKDPNGLKSQAVQDYLEEKTENEYVDEFGFLLEDRRSSFGLGITGGAWNYSGDYAQPKTFPSVGLNFEMLAKQALSIETNFAYGAIGSTNFYQGQVLLYEAKANYKWFQNLRSTPYTKIGLGGLLEMNNNQAVNASAFNRNYPFFIGEIGYEHLISKRIGITVGANYRYLFNDGLDKQEQGKYNDTFWGGDIGLKYYFPGKKSKRR
jgi:curli production assembly/transport component CsgG